MARCVMGVGGNRDLQAAMDTIKTHFDGHFKSLTCIITYRVSGASMLSFSIIDTCKSAVIEPLDIK